MLLGARQFFERRGAPTPPLPYDAEVEYLESTGTQWIDTGLICDIKRIVVVDIYHDYDGLNEHQFIVGGRVITGAGYYYRASTRSVYGQQYLEVSILLNSSSGATIPNGRSKIIINDDCLVDVNGTKYGNIVRESRNTTDTFHLLQYPDLYAFKGFVGRLYGCSISTIEGDVLIDLIPVRFTNEQSVSEGAMYDRLGVGGMNPDGSPRTDGLYRNRGTGALLYGPDKS